jgi:hypothetical protein
VIVAAPAAKMVDGTVKIPLDPELPVVAPVIVHVWLTTPQLSDAVGVAGVIVFVHTPASIPTVMLAGQLIDGAVLSVTITD